ncbi:MAG: hypothetical protein CR994_01205 [Maribacter sp.]|nr:MAG: hypothetical protein CR994_01205 [Maribacter sp.]
MINVVILGTGNVAKHLFDVFMAHEGIKVVQVYGRNHKALSSFGKHTKTTSETSRIIPADIYILAISDGAIAEISSRLDLKEGLLAHTSGSISMKSLPKKNRRGVFYPLQTFTVGRTVDFKEIPICIEAENDSDHALLEQLASTISGKVVPMDSKQRRSLHLAAVMANNFTNHMYYLSNEFCGQKNIPFDLLHPLIKETSNKIEDLAPYDAQTGPARRNDKKTLKKHLAQLKNKNHKELYSVLSKSIRKTYGKKL